MYTFGNIDPCDGKLSPSPTQSEARVRLDNCDAYKECCQKCAIHSTGVVLKGQAMETQGKVYPEYTVYDLLEYFDDYIHDAIKCVMEAEGRTEKEPLSSRREQLIAKDILHDFGTPPDGMTPGRYETAVIVAVYNHWHQS